MNKESKSKGKRDKIHKYGTRKLNANKQIE